MDVSSPRARILPVARELLSSQEFTDFRIAVNIFLSAVIYLFDFVTNILAAKEVYLLQKYQNPYTQRHLKNVFIIMMSFMVAAHIGNAIIFLLTLPREEQPLRQAYFLPLIQLWRLSKLVYFTATCSGCQYLETECRPLYNIVSVALETCYQIMIQLYVTIFVPASSRLILSLMASFISVAYNCGVAVSALTNSSTIGTKFAFGTVGGMYMLFSLVLRSLTYVVQDASRNPNYSLLLISLFIGMAINFFHIWFASSQRWSFSWRRLLRCFMYSYLGVTVGPLYPMLKELPKDKGAREIWRFQLRLCLAMANHLLLDIVSFATHFKPSQKKPWWDSTCGHGTHLLKQLWKPYYVLYTGPICHMYLPRFVYGVLLVIVSGITFLALKSGGIHNWEGEEAQRCPSSREQGHPLDHLELEEAQRCPSSREQVHPLDHLELEEAQWCPSSREQVHPLDHVELVIEELYENKLLHTKNSI